MDPKKWFTLCRTTEEGVMTRRQGGFWNVEDNKWNGEVRRNFWSVRVTEPWNNLPEEVKKQGTVNGFKNALDNLRGWGGQQTRNTT